MSTSNTTGQADFSFLGRSEASPRTVENKSIEGYYVIGVARMSASFRDKLRNSTLVAMLPVAV